MQKEFFVYILASKRYGTIYVGITSDLTKRIWEHKNGESDSFTKKYGIQTLVYYERHMTAEEAITREKRIKGWKRLWKIELIEKTNPDWHDLYRHFARSVNL